MLHNLPGIRGSSWDTRVFLGYEGLPGIRGSSWDTRVFLGYEGLPGIRGSSWDTRVFLGYEGLPGIRGSSWDTRVFLGYEGLPGIRTLLSYIAELHHLPKYTGRLRSVNQYLCVGLLSIVAALPLKKKCSRKIGHPEHLRTEGRTGCYALAVFTERACRRDVSGVAELLGDAE